MFRKRQLIFRHQNIAIFLVVRCLATKVENRAMSKIYPRFVMFTELLIMVPFRGDFKERNIVGVLINRNIVNIPGH